MSSGTEDTEWKDGDRVLVRGINQIGVVRYIGSCHSTDGVWIGIELLEPSGRHDDRIDGMWDGVRYFSCKKQHGIFVRPGACQRAKSPRPKDDGVSLSPYDRSNSNSYSNVSSPVCIQRRRLPSTPASSLIHQSSSTINQPHLPAPSTDDLAIPKLTLENLLESSSFTQRLHRHVESAVEASFSVISQRLTTLELRVNEMGKDEVKLFELVEHVINKNQRGGSSSERKEATTSCASDKPDNTQKGEVDIVDDDDPYEEIQRLRNALGTVSQLARQAQKEVNSEKQELEDTIQELRQQLESIKPVTERPP